METVKKTNEPETKADSVQPSKSTADHSEGLTANFHFASDEERDLGIETGIYQNGNTVKRIKLSTGKTAVVRELKGAEMKTVDGRAAGSKDAAFPVMMSLATKIDDQELVPEDFDSMKAKDWNKIKYAVASLNF